MATYSYPKKTPNLLLGYLLLIFGSLQLLTPLYSGAKILTACFLYVSGLSILVRGRRLRRKSDREWDIVLNAEGLQGQWGEYPRRFYWEEITALQVPFPSTDPCLQLSLKRMEKIILPLKPLRQRFELIRELKNYCKEVPGVTALEQVATPGKWFCFISISLVLGILLIFGLFLVVSSFVYIVAKGRGY